MIVTTVRLPGCADAFRTRLASSFKHCEVEAIDSTIASPARPRELLRCSGYQQADTRQP